MKGVRPMERESGRGKDGDDVDDLMGGRAGEKRLEGMLRPSRKVQVGSEQPFLSMRQDNHSQRARKRIEAKKGEGGTVRYGTEEKNGRTDGMARRPEEKASGMRRRRLCICLVRRGGPCVAGGHLGGSHSHIDRHIEAGQGGFDRGWAAASEAIAQQVAGCRAARRDGVDWTGGRGGQGRFSD